MLTETHSEASGMRMDRNNRNRSGLPAPRLTDRLLPHSIEAEQGVLGCILINPNESLPLCADKLAGSDAFYDLRHQEMFNAVLSMWDARELIDPITVQQKLKDNNQLEALGGVAYLGALMDGVPSASNIEYYIEIVREKHILRRLIQTCTQIVGDAYENGSVDELLNKAESDILSIGLSRSEAKERTVKEIVQDVITKIEGYQTQGAKGGITGVSTGFYDLNRLTGGFQKQDLIIIAGRPSVGKTAFAMNIAERIALDQDLPVGVISLEMRDIAIGERMISSRSQVNMRSVREGFMTEKDCERMAAAGSKVSESKLYITDKPMNMRKIRSWARRMVQQYGIVMLMVDYLQLVLRNDGMERQQEHITLCSNGFKNIAKELDIPVVILAQLNRLMEKEGHVKKGQTRSRKPRLSDLRDSGAIEQDADLVILLHEQQDDEDDEQDTPRDIVQVNAFVAKQRNGPIGNVPLTFMKAYTRYETVAKIAH